MKNLISSVFSHEIKNALSSIRFGIEIFNKYEMDPDEKKKLISDLLKTINNTIEILDEYMNFIKFQFTQKLKYETIELSALLEEIKSELLPFAKEKGINIYLSNSDVKIYNNKFWLKRAIYNIFYNAIKYNKKSGSVNIKIEKDLFGVYLSISDTGIGIDRKKIKSIFKVFEQIDENQKGVGIGLALSKSIIESFGGKISVKSNKNIGTDFILYIPNTPKEITFKKIALGIVPASVLLFLGISYFPIYSQNYQVFNNGGYISYKLEDGSVLKFTKDAKYEISLNKNLYNTKYIIDAKLEKGDMTLKAKKEKATINVGEYSFNNLGTDFELRKDENVKVAVFDGKVKGGNIVLAKKEGLIATQNGEKKVVLLNKVQNLEIKNNFMTFVPNPKALKYKIIISKDSDFSKIQNSFDTTKTGIKLNLDKDALYYIKVFAYDRYGLPSIPNVVKFVSLNHYYKALKLEKDNNFDEALLELQNSVSTIKQNSALPYYEISKLYYKNKNYKKSIFYIQKAIKIEKKVEYLRLLLDNYIALKEYKKVDGLVDDLLKQYPSDLDLLYYKALSLTQKDKYKEAQKTLFKILQIKPKDKKSNLLMSKVLEKLGKKELANYYKEMGQ